MGCYFSSHKLTDHGRHIFRVFNVNDLGAELSSGKIEVGDSDLILYQKGKEPIRWPLRCLRRYGFDEELFSFESGRRCPTGPGIYAFKCRRAEELFNLVQDSIQRVGQEGHPHTSQQTSRGTTSGRHNSRPTSVVESAEANGFVHPGNGHVAITPNEVLYINDSVLSARRDSQPNYINTGPGANETRSRSVDQATELIDFLHAPLVPSVAPQAQVNYADLDLPKSTENLFEVGEGACAPANPVNRLMPNFDNEEHEEQLSSLDIEDIGLSQDTDVFTDNPSEVTHQVNYININPGSQSITDGEGTAPRRSAARYPSIDRNYANIGANTLGNPAPVGSNTSNTRSSDQAGVLNYIEIDVNRSTDNVCGAAGGITPTASASTYTTPDSPTKRVDSYAMIDFNRTNALARPLNDDVDGIRKTRHNSTINDY